MLEVKNPNLSVEELMDKIKSELAAAEANGDTTKQSHARRRTSLLPQRLKDRRLGLSRSENEAIEFRGHYSLAELLGAEDELFIRNTYRAVLRREPDPGGADRYLQQLREGALPKIDLIGYLRYSPEGRRQGVRIQGLWLRFNLRKFYRWPLVGYAARWATACARLPHFVRNFERLHSSIHYQLGHLRQDNEALSQRLGVLTGAKRAAERRAEAAEKRLDAIEKMLVAVRGDIQAVVTRAAQLNELKADKVDNSSLPRFWVLDGNQQFLNRPAFTTSAQRSPDEFYSSFEDAFRDDRVVRLNQRQYLPYIKSSVTAEAPFLDCGCGRGEFLETLNETGIPAIGVDINRYEIERSDKRGLKIEQADMLSWLRQSDRMYGGISALQVIEHLDNNYLMQFLDSAVGRLAPGGVMILETVNPHCPSALGNFYQDPTHIKPIPPELLQFLVAWNGLNECKLAYLSLAPLPLRSFSEPRMNYQDYAVIGYKR